MDSVKLERNLEEMSKWTRLFQQKSLTNKQTKKILKSKENSLTNKQKQFKKGRKTAKN